MLQRFMLFAGLGAALVGCALSAAESQAQDVPNVLVMVEDSDRDTVPRDSRVHRNVIAGMNDRLLSRGYRVYDEQAVGIDGYQETTASDRVRRTDQELIAVANSVARPPIDVVLGYEAFASVDDTNFAKFAKLRLAGRALDPRSGRYMGSFEVYTPKTYKLPINCSRECLLENLSGEGREMGVELADVLADKLDQFFVPAQSGGGQQPVAGGTGGTSSVAGFERSYTLAFSQCAPDTRAEFEPYLVIFEGYVDHRPNRCSSTSCEYSYLSTIAPGKLQRNLEKMLQHSEIPGRVSVSGLDYKVTCTPARRTAPRPLSSKDW